MVLNETKKSPYARHCTGVGLFLICMGKLVECPFHQKLLFSKANRDLKQPRRRAEWTPTGNVLTKPATSACVIDVVHMAFRT